MDSIWDFIGKPAHFPNGGSKGSAEEEFLYGLDRKLRANKGRLTVYLRTATLRRAIKKELRKDLAALTDRDPILHAFLQKGTDEIPLGQANRFDQFIWDLYLRTGTKHFQVLTMFTNDIQANYFLLWERSRETFLLHKFFCSFFEVRRIDGRTVMIPRDLNFMEQSKALGATEVDNINNKAQGLSDLLYWNQFVVDESSKSPTSILFHRRFLMLQHSCRTHFQNVPLLTVALDPSNIYKLPLSFKKTVDFTTCLNAAEAFYDSLGRQPSWVAGVGAPMRQNLDQLGSAMSNYEASVTLVSGLPGTGKENYMDSLHFAGTSCDPGVGRRLVKTTALAMEQHPAGVAASFKERCSSFSQPITFVIDELNKAKERTRSELLRVLENSKETLERDLKVRFIMAASDHLDRLAQDPPQDFWTRITNQMRVAHPLGRVSEEDAEAFLEAFFWFNWWKLTKDWLDPRDAEEKAAIANDLLGGKLRDQPPGSFSLANLVCQEFVDTVTPIAIRDEISVRGVRSMMQQIFSSVIWSTRYGLVPVRHADRGTEAITRRAVNHAIQDVLAILNASRSTPRTASS